MALPNGITWRKINHVSYVVVNGNRTYRFVCLMVGGWRLIITEAPEVVYDGAGKRNQRKSILSQFVDDMDHAELIIRALESPNTLEVKE